MTSLFGNLALCCYVFCISKSLVFSCLLSFDHYQHQTSWCGGNAVFYLILLYSFTSDLSSYVVLCCNLFLPFAVSDR
eukprot:UN07663